MHPKSSQPKSSNPRPRRLALLLVPALVWAALLVVPASAQPLTGPAAGFDGDPATTERIAAGDPLGASVEISRVRFAGRTAAHAVVATVDDFADSLAGAALSGDGPLLLSTSDALAGATADELVRVLAPGATVYVLGGEGALAARVQDDVRALGFEPRRIEGPSRVETAVGVAAEVLRLRGSTTVLLARSEGPADNPTAGWADSVTGGALAAAAGLPVLVTPTSGLHEEVAAFLAEHGIAATILLGGEAALSEAVEASVPGPRRLAGPERTATAAEIAAAPEWPRGDGTRHVVLDGGRADGWAYGFSAAGLAADAGAPPLLVLDGVSAATRREVSTCGDPAVDLLVIGDQTIVSEAVVDELTDLDGLACAPGAARLRSFDDCDAVLDHFVTEALDRVGPYGLDGQYYGAPEVFIDTFSPEAPSDGGTSTEDSPAAAPEPEGISSDSAGSGGGTTSATNVQEAGVDEPDRVKIDARAAFIATGPDIQVVGLSPTAAPSLLTTVTTPRPVFDQELLLDGDVLLVLGRGNGYVEPTGDAPQQTSFAPEYFFPDPTTELTRYDVSDPAAPRLLDATTIDGDYRSARMVDGVVRLVTSSNPSGLDFVFPADESDAALASALEHNRQVVADSTLQTWLPQVGSPDAGVPLVGCGSVATPAGFSGISTVSVSTIDVSSGVTPTSAAAVVAQGETVYASTDRLVLSTSQWGQWNDAQPEAVTTLLHSFDITDPAATTYVASGQVDGYVLSSFSLSERDGYYRIATTTEPPWRGEEVTGETDNGITVLTEGGGQLFEVGRVFGLGLGERIFAVRFLGDIAAVITFRQTDPLYLVDLADPAAPRVTGELSIPGVSRYLHPLDDDHLLGVGQDGTDDGQLTGLQVSLFDISDRAAPTRVDSLEFGPGDSPVEYDHKSFLHWAPLGRAVVPAQLYGPDYESYRAGAQAIDIDTGAQTLTLAGEVVQPPLDGYPVAIDRTFVADGVLYTLSYAGVGAHDLVTLADRGFAPLPQPEGGGCCIVID